MTRRSRRRQLAAGGGLLAALALGLALGANPYRDRGPASPAALDRIEARNDKAAIDAAARMKAESEASAAAADARRRAAEAASDEPALAEGAKALR